MKTFEQEAKEVMETAIRNNIISAVEAYEIGVAFGDSWCATIDNVNDIARTQDCKATIARVDEFYKSFKA